jgi:arylsulfatase A-like enzyme
MKRVSLFIVFLLGVLQINAQNKNTNIVIIMADQLRYDVVGKEYTPNINKLIAEGVSFNRAYTVAPLCVPSRGSFFTGNYPNETHSIINGWVKRDEIYQNVQSNMPNLYQLFENDWDSWHSGKQHFMTEHRLEDDPNTKTKWSLLPEDYNKFLKQNRVKPPGGADYKGYLPEESSGYSELRTYSIPTTGVYKPGYDYFYDGWIKNQAVKAIKNRDKPKPFLLNAMFLAPHPPFQIPEPYFSMYKNSVIKIPENVGKLSIDQSPLQAYNITGFLGFKYTREEWSRVWPVYLGLVSLLDYSVGEIVKELKAQNMYDNTIIIFTADHGEMLGSHKLWQKDCMYEEAAKIPLVIKFPKSYQPKVKVVDKLISNIDVFPTLCDFLNVKLPKPVSGRSLMPLMNAKPFDRDEIFIQYDGNGARGNAQRSVIKGNYKLIVDMFKNETFLELYDVVNDSQELKNLAFNLEYRQLIESSIRDLKGHMQRTKDLIKLEDNVYEAFLKNYQSSSGGTE